MTKMYYLRHQAHGIVHEFPFAQPPSPEQQKAVGRYCFQLHGFGHPKTPDQPYWLRVVEVELLDPTTLPQFEERKPKAVAAAAGKGAAEVRELGVSGVGHVTTK